MTNETKTMLEASVLLLIAMLASFGLGYNLHRIQTERAYYTKTHAVIVPGAHIIDDVRIYGRGLSDDDLIALAREQSAHAEDAEFTVSYWVCDTPECKERKWANDN